MHLLVVSCLLLSPIIIWGSEEASLNQSNFNDYNNIEIGNGLKKPFGYDCCLADSNENIKNFIINLSLEQKAVLENFFRLVVQDHTSGYVLFGDKPLCIESYSLEAEGIELPGISQDGAVVKWVEFWQKLDISSENKDYFFFDFDFFEYGCHQIICINRRAFIRAVNDNLNLFRYVLGPNLTAENLLKELVQAKERFYNVLKYDNVLLGILLGYGPENALLVSREELISDAFYRDHKEDFPLIEKK